MEHEPGKTEASKGYDSVHIDEIDSLICYLLRGKMDQLAVASNDVNSMTFIPTLAFEHVRRRGNRSYSRQSVWGKNKELKIKR